MDVTSFTYGSMILTPSSDFRYVRGEVPEFNINYSVYFYGYLLHRYFYTDPCNYKRPRLTTVLSGSLLLRRRNRSPCRAKGVV